MEYQESSMDKVVFGLATKSAKIRALSEAGYKRADIARFLGIRYQHVRNVLVDARAGMADAPAVPYIAAPDDVPDQYWTRVGPDGRIMIPASFRRALGLEQDAQLLMMLEDGEVRLLGRDAAIRRAQALVAKYVPPGTSLVDELIAERKAEAARDDGEKP